MTRRSTTVSALAAMGLLALCLTGCTSTTGCFPASLSVTPTTASAGGVVMLSSPTAECPIGYATGHTYSVTLTNRGATGQPIIAAVARNGAFSIEVPIPADFPHGTAYIIVTRSPYDNCEDGASCAGYSVSLTVK